MLPCTISNADWNLLNRTYVNYDPKKMPVQHIVDLYEMLNMNLPTISVDCTFILSASSFMVTPRLLHPSLTLEPGSARPWGTSASPQLCVWPMRLGALDMGDVRVSTTPLARWV